MPCHVAAHVQVIDEETEKQFIHERRKAPDIGEKDYLRAPGQDTRP